MCKEKELMFFSNQELWGGGLNARFGRKHLIAFFLNLIKSTLLFSKQTI